jgi:hypothetical protein
MSARVGLTTSVSPESATLVPKPSPTPALDALPYELGGAAQGQAVGAPPAQDVLDHDVHGVVAEGERDLHALERERPSCVTASAAVRKTARPNEAAQLSIDLACMVSSP